MSSSRALQRVSAHARSDISSRCLQCHLQTHLKHIASPRQHTSRSASTKGLPSSSIACRQIGRLVGQARQPLFLAHASTVRAASNKASPSKTDESKSASSKLPSKPRITTVRASNEHASHITFNSADSNRSRRPPDRSVAPAPAVYNVTAASIGDPNKRQIEQARRLLGKEDEVLLYIAPSHKSLLFSCLLGGTTFLMTCATAGQSMLMIPDFPMLLRVPAVIGSIIGIAMSSAIFWTPLRQINSLRLIRDGESNVLMQVESKSRLLTGRKRRFNVALSDMRSDRNIRASVVDYSSVERSDAHKWTEFVQRREALQRRLTSRISLAWKEMDITGALGRFWPATKLNTSRMFARAGMTYVRIENQNWKLDLTNAYVLDRGFPLTELIKEDPEVRDSVFGTVRRHLSTM